MAEEAPDRKRSWFQDTIHSLQPDTNNLVILVVAVIVIYAMFILRAEATRMADTALGGLLGYLGATRKGGV